MVYATGFNLEFNVLLCNMSVENDGKGTSSLITFLLEGVVFEFTELQLQVLRDQIPESCSYSVYQLGQSPSQCLESWGLCCSSMRAQLLDPSPCLMHTEKMCL